jgi:hypothetical protein
MPPAQPSIKGIALQYAVEAVRRLLVTGRLTRDELEVRLDAADLEILDQKLVPGLWYPVESCGRLLEVATAGESHQGGVEAVVAVGVDAAERLFDSEVYGHFVESASARGPRAGFTLVRLAPLLCSFSEWTFHEAPGGGFVVEVNDADEFPEILRHVAQGLIQYLVDRLAGAPQRMRVTSERPARGHIRYVGRPVR